MSSVNLRIPVGNSGGVVLVFTKVLRGFTTVSIYIMINPERIVSRLVQIVEETSSVVSNNYRGLV